jgi:peptidoglycan/LPS O-acetylase OafA/YrhL
MGIEKKTGYLPSLDGWRAVAILGVLMSHDQPWGIGHHTTAPWKGFGGGGVYLFFAISGLLICTRILEDEAAVGHFRLKAFYIRRIFRIQPAALSYLAVIAVLMLLGIVHEQWHFWLGGLFLYQNFLFHTQSQRLIYAGFFTGHFWTLSVEEHFYIVLSLFLYFVKRYRVFGLVILLVCFHIARKIALSHEFYSYDTSTRRTYWVINSLIWPALFALLLRREDIRSFAIRFVRPWLVFSATVALIVCGEYMASGQHTVGTLYGFDGQYMRLLFYLYFWVIATMLHPKSWTTRFLELAPIRYMGRLSYSIYVWHLIFLCTTFPLTYVTWAPLVWVGHRPWRYVGILVVSVLSYHFIEKPMIRLGHKLAPPATPGHRDLEVQPTATPS